MHQTTNKFKACAAMSASKVRRVKVKTCRLCTDMSSEANAMA